MFKILCILIFPILIIETIGDCEQPYPVFYLYIWTIFVFIFSLQK